VESQPRSKPGPGASLILPRLSSVLSPFEVGLIWKNATNADVQRNRTKSVSIAARLFAKIICPNIRLGNIVMKASPMTLLASGKEPKDPR